MAVRPAQIPLVLLSCLGLVACGSTSTAGLGPATNDAPEADVARADTNPSDVGADGSGGGDTRGTDAETTDLGVADRVAAEAGSTDAGNLDSSAMDVNGADLSVVDATVTDVGGADLGVVDVTASDAAGGTDGRADVGPEAGMDVVVPADVPACMGTHPLLDAGARFCGAGQCYCPTPGANGDSCLPTGNAAACCPGRAVTCAVGGDAGPTCPTGTHPLLDAGARFCGPGQCYCPPAGASGDSCLPMGTAPACCPGRSMTCVVAIGDAGPTCPTGTHPLVDGGARFCAPGSCYCPSSDACRPVAIARMCCPTAVICD